MNTLMVSLQHTIDTYAHKERETLDKLLNVQLGVKTAPEQIQASTMEPMHLRKPNWNKIRQDYEIKKKNEFWQARIAEVEAADKAKESK